MDEEYCYKLKLSILDTTNLLHRKISISDSTAVKCVFDFHSIWDWSVENIKMEGYLIVLSITENNMTVDLHITVRDLRRKKIYLYTQKRKYTSSELQSANAGYK
jgi:hypothetical protein